MYKEGEEAREPFEEATNHFQRLQGNENKPTK